MDKVLITGATGFLGSQLCKIMEGSNLIKLSSKTNLLNGSVAEAVFAENVPDYVIHCAAKCGGIEYNKKYPYQLFLDNIKMGINVIENAIKYKTKKFVLVSTICSYPKFTKTPFKESDIWNGYPEETNAPYGIAKKSLQVMLESARTELGFNGITVLPVNMAGPGDHFDETSHIIPLAISKINYAKRNGTNVEFLSTGNATRELIDVRDAARAIKLCLHNYEDNFPINIGTGKEISIRELIKIISKKMDYTGHIVWRGELDGQPRRCLDVSKLNELGFSPIYSLEETIQSEIEEYYGCHNLDKG